jgi:hypothetical protein
MKSWTMYASKQRTKTHVLYIRNIFKHEESKKQFKRFLFMHQETYFSVRELFRCIYKSSSDCVDKFKKMWFDSSYFSIDIIYLYLIISKLYTSSITEQNIECYLKNVVRIILVQKKYIYEMILLFIEEINLWEKRG